MAIVHAKSELIRKENVTIEIQFAALFEVEIGIDAILFEDRNNPCQCIAPVRGST